MKLLPQDNRKLGWTPYAWLIYLSFQFVQPVLTGSLQDWLLVVGSVIVFLPLYFAGFWRHGRAIVPIIVAIAGLGLLTSPFNSASSCYFIYAAAFAASAGPPRVAVRIIAAIVAAVLLAALWPGIPFFGWITGAAFSILIGGINIHYAEVERSNRRLRLAQEEVERLATLAERERIARDLHDLLGHTLSTITLKSQVARRLVGKDDDAAQREIEEVETISREALAEVRRAVQNYRHARIGPELTKAKVALAAAAVTLEIETRPYDLQPEVEDAVALALREAVTNVVRHARAERCKISLGQDTDSSTGSRFVLVVEDDGRGGTVSEGSGLKGMRERIEGFDGSVDFDGNGDLDGSGDLDGTGDRDGTSGGTRLSISLPTHGQHSREVAAG